MDQSQDTTIHQKGKHFSKENRYMLQGFLKCCSQDGTKPSLRTLAKVFNCAPNTIKKEFARGSHPNTGKYSAARAQRDYNSKHANSCMKPYKALQVSTYLLWVTNQFRKEKWSLDACAGRAKAQALFKKSAMVCSKTLYNYVDLQLLPSIRNIDLPAKLRRRRHKDNVRRNLRILGESIDSRDDNVLLRKEFGHWEVDTVIGSKLKGDKVLLTLCERLTRKYIAIQIPSKTAEAVMHGMEIVRKYFGSRFSQVFKTITADNGSEFALLAELENQSETKVYFAHPYSSWERGSNERANGLLRRLIPKGKRIDGYQEDDIFFATEWANNLPRKCLGYKSPNEYFDEYLDRIYAA